MALERVPDKLNFRADEEVQRAIKEMSVRLETNNLSEIVRTTLLIGLDRARAVEDVVLRRARTEGILAGLEQIKKRVGLVVEELLREVRPGAPGEEVARGEGEEAPPSVYPDVG